MKRGQDLLDVFMALTPDEQREAYRGLTLVQRREWLQRWSLWAHPGQLAPPGDWRVWLIQAGRGFGKTRAGAEWVSEIARTVPDARIALVGATIDDARRVMVQGTSGLLSVARAGERPVFRASALEVAFDNGARASLYSAQAPEGLRGPEHDAAWCDELAKWGKGGDATRTFGELQYLPTGAAGAFAANPEEKLIDLVQALRAPYRQGAAFVMNSATLARIRKFKTSTGEMIWQPGLAAGQPATLLGYPVVEAEDMPDIAANSLSIAFGNFTAGYLIAERHETVILRDPYSNKPFVHFYATKRVGGAVSNSEAIKILKFAAS